VNEAAAALLSLPGFPGTLGRWTALPQPPQAAALHPLEQALVVDVAPRRRAHFAAGRACAHAALAALGHPVEALLRSADGAPLWPAGVVGSISHCPDAAVAVVADRRDWAALGVDVETDRALADDAAAYVLAEPEHARFAALPGGLAQWALPAFAAKECVHKCVHPLSGVYLAFDEVAIHFEVGPAALAQAGFTVEALSDKARVALAGHDWRGQWRRQDGLLFSLLAGR
jgi:enterobactin synthetase component D